MHLREGTLLLVASWAWCCPARVPCLLTFSHAHCPDITSRPSALAWYQVLCKLVRCCRACSITDTPVKPAPSLPLAHPACIGQSPAGNLTHTGSSLFAYFLCLPIFSPCRLLSPHTAKFLACALHRPFLALAKVTQRQVIQLMSSLK